MDEKITFRTEIEFYGSPDDLSGVIAKLKKLPLKIDYDKWPRPRPIPGGWPFPLLKVLSPEILSKITKGQPAFPQLILDDIWGGIRDPHLHFKDQVVLLDREAFAKVVGSAADKIVSGIAIEQSYSDTIGTLCELNEMKNIG